MVDVNTNDEDELADESHENSHGSDVYEWQKMPISSDFSGGGAERDRTADLLIAKLEVIEVARQQWTACMRLRPVESSHC